MPIAEEVSLVCLAKPGFWPRAALVPSWLFYRAIPGAPQPHVVRTKCPQALSLHCWKLNPTPVGPQLHCSHGQRSKPRIQPEPWHETKCLGLQKKNTKNFVCLNCAFVKPPCPRFSRRGCKGKTAWAAGIHVCNTCDIPLRISFLQGL